MWDHQHSSSNLLYELSQKHYVQRLIMSKFTDVIVELMIHRLNRHSSKYCLHIHNQQTKLYSSQWIKLCQMWFAKIECTQLLRQWSKCIFLTSGVKAKMTKIRWWVVKLQLLLCVQTFGTIQFIDYCTVLSADCEYANNIWEECLFKRWIINSTMTSVNLDITNLCT